VPLVLFAKPLRIKGFADFYCKDVNINRQKILYPK